MGMERKGQLAEHAQQGEAIAVSRLFFGENVRLGFSSSSLNATHEMTRRAPRRVSDPRLAQTGVTRIFL